MKLGTENKKSLYAAVILGVGALYGVYSQFFSGPSYGPTRLPAPTASTTPGPDVSQAKEKVARPRSKNNGEFRPVYRQKKKEDRPDPEKIDPSLRLDLLAKIMKIPAAGGERDLFLISKTPPLSAAAIAPKGPEPKVFIPYGPNKPPPPAPPPPPVQPHEDPPRTVPFHYYAYSAVHPNGKRTAYFIQGDQIMMADEGQSVEGGWRVLQITIDKVLLEDTKDPKKHKTPVNIEPEATQ